MPDAVVTAAPAGAAAAGAELVCGAALVASVDVDGVLLVVELC
jgi:hypothetical protein